MSEERLDLKIVRTGREHLNLPRSQIVQWLADDLVSTEDLVKPAGARNWLKISMAPEFVGTQTQPTSEPAQPSAKQSPRPTPSPGRASGSAQQARWRQSKTSGQTSASPGTDLGIDVPAKPKRKRKLRILEESVVDMTPMIDVTFQLLIFFMFTNQMANPNPITVPEAEYGKGVAPDDKQVVLIDDEGRYYFGENTREEDIEPSLDALVQKVADQASLREGPLDVIITAHKDSKHVGMRELMDRISKLENIGQIRLGVEEKQ